MINVLCTCTNFQNMLVKTEFATIEERLKEQRKLRIKHEGILPEMHPKNGTYARLSAFRRDPIETFKKYAEFSGVNLHDVFNGGHRLRLDANEFKDLIRVILKLIIYNWYCWFMPQLMLLNCNLNQENYLHFLKSCHCSKIHNFM